MLIRAGDLFLSGSRTPIARVSLCSFRADTDGDEDLRPMVMRF